MVRALTLGVCRADVRPVLGVLQVKLNIPLSVRSIIMSQAMNPQCQVEWCSISHRNGLVTQVRFPKRAPSFRTICTENIVFIATLGYLSD